MSRKWLSLIVALHLFIIGFGQTKEIIQVRKWREKNEHTLLKNFIEFLSVPNIAADPNSLAKNATVISEMLLEQGVKNIQLLRYDTEKVPPVVYGEVIVPGATSTIVFYAHYDGQPVNPANWYKGLEPFSPKLGNGPLGKSFEIISYSEKAIDPSWRVYARGASDDKAGVYAIINAYKALRSTGETPGVNIKFFFEGEEEAGSPHLPEILRKYSFLLKSDLWIICDGPVHQSGKKDIVFGVRGDTNMELILYGPKKPLHSGHYGNWVQNPAWQLVQLLSTMKNEKGEVTIKGFYDDVIPLTEMELKAVADLPPVEGQMKKELGIIETEARAGSLYASYNYPSLNINGIRSAEVGELAANVIATKASVALDLRLVAGNDWKKQQNKVIDHVKTQGYHVVENEPTDEERQKFPRIIQVVRKGGYNAQKTAMDLPEAKKIIKAVQSTSAEQILLLPTSGGSLPLILFEQYLKAKCITVPLANHDNNQHAENENIRIRNLWEGIETMAAIMLLK